MNELEKNLDLLSLFHFILGGFTILFACLPLIHVGVGVALLTGAFNSSPPPPAIIGWVFVVMGSLIVLGGWAIGGAMIAAGRMLKRRKSRTACIVIAALECLLMPFGTILGILTICLLTREPAQALFDAPAPSSKIAKK